MVKKKEISNKELILFGTIAFVVSMLATLSFLNPYGITGLAAGDTALFRVNITMDSVVDISLPTSTISFGSMEPGELNATGNLSITDSPRGFEVQNDGNVAIDVNITSSKAASSLWNGTSAGTNFEWNCTIDVNGSNPGLYGRANLSSWSAVATTKTAGTSAPGVIFAEDLNFTDATDNATLNIKIIVPDDEPAWTTGATITFGAWQA